MKRFFILALTAMVAAFAADPIVPSAPKLDTDGCYAISTAEELYGFADIVNASNTHDECGKLTKDIVVNEKNVKDTAFWKPIDIFHGVFDGQNHTISGLMYTDTSASGVGFFTSVSAVTKEISYGSREIVKYAVVKNLGLLDAHFYGKNYVGGIAGGAWGAKITNCYVDGSVYSSLRTGGLVGNSGSLEIRDSRNLAYVGGYYSGGLVGLYEEREPLTIVNSYNAGTISSNGTYGSFVGYSLGKLEIINSFNVGEKSLSRETLPLVGHHDRDTIIVDNYFYIKSRESDKYGTIIDESELKNGKLAQRLRNYNKDGIDGLVWGQWLGVDDIPQLTGKFVVGSSKNNIVAKTPAVVGGCYQIGSAEELYGFAFIANASQYSDVPVCGKLTKDIVVNKNVLAKDTLNGDGSNFIPWLAVTNFAGTFDGTGHTISGLYFNDSWLHDAMGLFATVFAPDQSHEVKIENVGIEDSYFYVYGTVGSLIGAVESKSKTVTLKKCYASSYLRGASGGLVGDNSGDSLRIEDSYYDGVLESNENTIGGLLGWSGGKFYIVNSYSVADLKTDFSFTGAYYGSLIGTNSGETKSYVVNSYGADPLSKKESRDAYPLVGFASAGSVEFINSYSEKTGTEVACFNCGSKKDFGIIQVDADNFMNGSVATLLHNYGASDVNGALWGQHVGYDSYPVFSGDVSTNFVTSDLKLVTFPEDTVKYSNKYIEGIKLSLPIPVRKDHIFKGWYVSADFSGEPVKSVPAEATGTQTFYAKWWHYPQKVGDCYELGNEGELILFSSYVDSLFRYSEHPTLCAKLTADIVVNKNVLVNGKLDTTRTDTLEPWIPMHGYNGVFDGNGHSISGLYSTGYHCLYDNGRLACGLFGKIERGNLVIKNLGIVDTYFLGGDDMGGFVGSMRGNSLVIANSYFDGVLLGIENVGGLVGYLDVANAVVLASYNLGLVDGDYDVGGLVGIADDVDKLTVLYSYNEGPVKGIQAVGGLVGQGVTEKFLIANSYNVGTVTSTKSVNGGLVGDFTFDSVYVYNSYDLGAVSGTDSLGAIYGLKRKSVVLDMDSVYYLEGLSANDGAIAVAAEDFANKNLLKRLQSYKNHGLDGSAWVQSDSDKYPVLNKKVSDKFIDSVFAAITAPGSSSSSSVSSSSSAPKSSSSSVAQSSSSSVKSSSSNAPKSSSSSVKSSSSSGAPKSSSSSVQSSSSMPKSSSSLVKSSSSKTSKSSSSSAKSSNSSVKSSSSKTPKSSSSGKVSIEATLALSPVVVHTLGRMVEISGLRVGESYALMDLQGRLLQRGFANGSTVMLQVAQSGRYLLRIAGRNKIVNVR